MNNRTLRLWHWLRVAVAAASIILLTLTVAGLWHATWLLRLQIVAAVVGINVAALLVVVVLTLLTGRTYCSVLCPLGIWMDFVQWVGRCVGWRPAFAYAPQRLRHVVAPLLAVAALVAHIAGLYYVVALLDPFAVYSRAVVTVCDWVGGPAHGLPASVGSAPLLVRWSVIVSMAVATVSALLWGRQLCHLVCPVGYALGWLSRRPLWGVRIDAARCDGCGRCAERCSSACLDIAHACIDRSRCVACMDCVAECRRGALRVGLRVGRRSDGCQSESPAAPSLEPSLSAPSATRGSVGDAIARPLAVGVGLLAARAVAQDDDEVVWSDGQTQYVTRRLHDQRRIVTTLGGEVTVERYEAIMPPCTVSRTRFQSRCIACHACIAACPQHILRPASDEYGEGGRMQPTVSYELGWCRPDCTRCGDVCPTGAIRPLPVAEKAQDKLGWANFNSRTCITATEGIECDACVRHCPTRAITMTSNNGHRMPRIRVSLCTGCGACEYYCPARPKAIYVEGLKW